MRRNGGSGSSLRRHSGT
ncbi:Protein CBG27724 [Caenorhabditis briggsae]|uniref:Protein CBG27724 n=1 Tax=Caenorhabditis briggsae TaxID=6238 RepID=B6IJ22_CAEBR|nr:Protein CBG27724 [Caenorhabditis briggsae]CAS00002.1 Protein CBG27724 [Caenorhabditis briggsae]